MKNILFLDFDGVLVTDRGQKYHLETNGTLRDEHGALFDMMKKKIEDIFNSK